MKEISLTSYIKKYIEDDYAMEVLYQTAKKTLAEQDFSLHRASCFPIDGRFMGEPFKVTSKANYRKTVHALSFLLSLRLLMVNHKYLQLCEDDSLMLIAIPRESFQWISYMTFIMDNWDDKEVKMLFTMMENFYYDEELSNEEKEEFKKSIALPEYKNERKYYQCLAGQTKGISDIVIGDNGFLEAAIEEFTIPKEIAYVGNTAFSYCDKLETIEFEGKVMFGLFPILECDNLKQIVVPDGLGGYYKECLPYYKDLISEKSDASVVKDIGEGPFSVMEMPISSTNEGGVGHAYVSIPPVAPYEEKDVSHPEHLTPPEKPEEIWGPIDFKSLQKVFEKKATSYKYFWMMAIVSLAKERQQMSIPFQDIVVRMAAMAWPIVIEDEIDFGYSDMMKKYLEDVVKKTTLIRAASSKVVENYLLQHYSSQGIDKILAPLLKNVPYRFLSPWVKYTTEQEVIEKSCSKDFNGLYALHTNYIVLNEEWWDYIEKHYQDVCDFAMRSFISYARMYNNDIKLLNLMTTGWQLINDNPTFT